VKKTVEINSKENLAKCKYSGTKVKAIHNVERATARQTEMLNESCYLGWGVDLCEVALKGMAN